MTTAHIVGSSPELLVRVHGRAVEYRPIAGTRPRSADEVEDRAIEADLRADEKEVAEHIMLVDLGRNDVGRVSEFGVGEGEGPDVCGGRARGSACLSAPFGQPSDRAVRYVTSTIVPIGVYGYTAPASEYGISTQPRLCAKP